MAAADMIYIKHRSGRQSTCSEDQLKAMQAEGWTEERRVAVAAVPKKKAKKASKKAD